MGRIEKVLSKCYLWRIDILKVLITIGSMVEKKFTRLFHIIDELCKEQILDGHKVLAQVGFDNYESSYYKTFDLIPDEEFKQIIEESDLVISHAGTGTVTSCLKKGKKVIVFPRLATFDEHYDNHQLELAELFSKGNYVLCANDKDELVKCIKNLNEFNPTKFYSNNDKINNIIIDFIENSPK